MHLTLPLNKFNINNIFFLDKTKNNILNGGNFHRILYSSNCVTFNGVFLLFNIKITKYERYFNKIKCFFKENENTDVVNTINLIEKQIMDNFPYISNLKPEYQINEQLKTNIIKIIDDNAVYKETTDVNVILKISGIWSNGNKYGVTFRFFVTHQ